MLVYQWGIYTFGKKHDVKKVLRAGIKKKLEKGMGIMRGHCGAILFLTEKYESRKRSKIFIRYKNLYLTFQEIKMSGFMKA